VLLVRNYSLTVNIRPLSPIQPNLSWVAFGVLAGSAFGGPERETESGVRLILWIDISNRIFNIFIHRLHR